jgi:cysteamine dioxygenase
MGPVLQQLIEYCEQTFSTDVTQPWELNRLLSFIRQLNADNLELSERCQSMDRSTGWDFEDLYTSDRIFMKLLMIPKGKKIPLHDHPEMSAIVKMIWGSMQITCYDWVLEYPYTGLARMIQDTSVDGASEPDLLLPRWKNLHTMQALEDCAFIDIFSPHYYDDENRKCTYYKVGEEVVENQEVLYQLEATN